MWIRECRHCNKVRVRDQLSSHLSETAMCSQIETQILTTANSAWNYFEMQQVQQRITAAYKQQAIQDSTDPGSTQAPSQLAQNSKNASKRTLAQPATSKSRVQYMKQASKSSTQHDRGAAPTESPTFHAPTNTTNSAAQPPRLLLPTPQNHGPQQELCAFARTQPCKLLVAMFSPRLSSHDASPKTHRAWPKCRVE